MKAVRSFRCVVAVTAFVSLITVPCLLSAQEKAQIEKPVFDDLPSPEFNSGKNKAFKPKDWLEVEAKVRLPKGQRDELYVDQITVKWYVAVKNKEGKGFFLLTKDVNHINVPVDEDFFVSVYLSPSSIKRLTGQQRAGKNSVDRVGIEILRGGVKIAEISSKERPGWWNAPSLARSDKFPLLDKNQTPFRTMWWDRYAEILEKP